VAKNAKYHSNPTKADLSTAENVGQKEDPQEEADIKPLQANIQILQVEEKTTTQTIGISISGKPKKERCLICGNKAKKLICLAKSY